MRSPNIEIIEMIFSFLINGCIRNGNDVLGITNSTHDHSWQSFGIFYQRPGSIPG